MYTMYNVIVRKYFLIYIISFHYILICYLFCFHCLLGIKELQPNHRHWKSLCWTAKVSLIYLFILQLLHQ